MSPLSCPHAGCAALPHGLTALAARGLILTALAGALSLAANPAHAQAAQASQVYAIPAGTLEAVLTRFALESGVMLSFSGEALAGQRSPGLRGRHEVAAALRLLLAGTGVVAQAQPNGGFVLTRPPAPGAADASLPVLPTVRVVAGGDRDEGTASQGYVVASATVAGFTRQPLLDTPLSVKVLPAELLANQGVDTIGGLERLDAAITASAHNPGGFSTPSIRGFGLDNWSNYRYNGLTMVNQQATGLENKERVEVLKGLSGLQAGFSAPGGLINLVTKRPAADAISDLSVAGTQFGQTRIHADLSRRTQDGRFGVRVNLAAEEERSYVRQVSGPRRFASLAGDWQVTPTTALQVDVEHERREQRAQPDLVTDVAGRLPRDVDPRTYLGQPWSRYPTQSTILSGRLLQDLAQDWSLTAEVIAMTLERDQKAFYLSGLQPDGDAQVDLYDSPDQTRKPTTARVLVAGSLQTGALRHELSMGASTYRHRAWWGQGYWGSIGTTNIHRPVAIADPLPVVSASALAREDRESGLFVQDVVAVGDAWRVHLGGRYARREQRSLDTTTGAQTQRYARNVFTPSVALVFKPTATMSAYVSYVQGLEQGGTAPLDTRNRTQQMAPLVSTQWEAGVKMAVAENLSGELAVFRLTKPAEYTNADNVYAQDGERRHQGVEAAITGRLTREWTVLGSVMLLDARLRDTGDVATQGKRPAGVPRHRLAAVAEYSPTALPDWTFTGSWTRGGARATDDANLNERAPAYDVFGIGARQELRIGQTPATLWLNVDNVFDRRYWSDVTSSLIAGAPRTVSARLAMRF